jgi:hypothetical protein
MTLVEQLRMIAEEQAASSPAEQGYRELAEFYDEMVRLGILKKNEYEFPRLDTIGRSLHRRLRGKGSL